MGVTHCLSICQAIYNERQRAKHKKLQDLWTAKTDRGAMKDLLCCARPRPPSCPSALHMRGPWAAISCGEGAGLCESLGSSCTYGCSPFVESYTDAGYKARKCENIPGQSSPNDAVYGGHDSGEKHPLSPIILRPNDSEGPAEGHPSDNFEGCLLPGIPLWFFKYCR